ncbi:unnamed protein product [Caenorhabditis sp. 36 PRJEB53466]|nr:unnamed protein product [Caenorhabditis sp. 36 PRJEB53466]
MFLFLFVLPALSSATNYGAVHVSGLLFCNGTPYVNEKIELYEKNYALPDNKLFTARTDSQGNFSVKASGNDWLFKPQVYVYIPNYCVDVVESSYLECGHTVRIYIPDLLSPMGTSPKRRSTWKWSSYGTFEPNKQFQLKIQVLNWTPKRRGGMKEILLLLLLVPILCSARQYGAVHVRGQLLCDGKPYANEKVQLHEKNYVMTDGTVAISETDDQGFFSVKASASDLFTKPKFYLYFVNFCSSKLAESTYMECGYTIRVYIPEMYVAEGNIPKAVFNMEQIEIATAKTEYAGLERIIHPTLSHSECREKKRKP